MTIHNRLKEIRKKIGLNQIPFAKRIGASQSAYANYERGVTDLPIALAQVICDEFGVSANWLLMGQGNVETSVSDDILIESVTEMLEFVSKNDLNIPNTDQAKLVRFLVQEKVSGNQTTPSTMSRVYEVMQNHG